MRFAKRVAIGAAIAGALLMTWHRLPRSVFYGASGPTPIGKAVTTLMVWWSGAGLPPHRQVALEIRGRKSGLMRALPVGGVLP